MTIVYYIYHENIMPKSLMVQKNDIFNLNYAY